MISAIREEAGQKVFQMSAPISPGSSGGPVFDTTGHVIGVAFAGMDQGQNLNFAMPIDYVKQLIATGTPTALTASAGAVMVFVTKEGRKYHREDCGYLRQGRVVITLQQAIQSGYTPCSVCNPPSRIK